jgi:hypothetical protein
MDPRPLTLAFLHVSDELIPVFPEVLALSVILIQSEFSFINDSFVLSIEHHLPAIPMLLPLLELPLIELALDHIQLSAKALWKPFFVQLPEVGQGIIPVAQLNVFELLVYLVVDMLVKAERGKVEFVVKHEERRVVVLSDKPVWVQDLVVVLLKTLGLLSL